MEQMHFSPSPYRPGQGIELGLRSPVRGADLIGPNNFGLPPLNSLLEPVRPTGMAVESPSAARSLELMGRIDALLGDEILPRVEYIVPNLPERGSIPEVDDASIVESRKLYDITTGRTSDKVTAKTDWLAELLARREANPTEFDAEAQIAEDSLKIIVNPERPDDQSDMLSRMKIELGETTNTQLAANKFDFKGTTKRFQDRFDASQATARAELDRHRRQEQLDRVMLKLDGEDDDEETEE